eukprot:TRINITY_DN4089_c0_g2_i1.p1 TRINITY_DN4089_c0_g2~~TRINITY_DN4089_c0_g2_i1.p1  ORF type:complete len:393 (-),score=95.49 TRINITY_DN4089_c0_g2_i1:167-1345(-)
MMKMRFQIDRSIHHYFPFISSANSLRYLTPKIIQNLEEGLNILNHFNFNSQSIFHHLYPEFKLFEGMSTKDPLLQKRTKLDSFLLAHHYFVDSKAALYEVSVEMLRAHRGGTVILKRFQWSPLLLFDSVYLELRLWAGGGMSGKDSQPLKRLKVDTFILDHLRFVETQGDLGELSKQHIEQFEGGGSMLALHQGSARILLGSVYEELVVERKRERSGFWEDFEDNFLLKKIIKCYQIRDKKDWYNLSLLQLSKVHGKSTKSKKNLKNLLEFWYPEEEWSASEFSNPFNRKSKQRLLGVQLQLLFKNEPIYEDFKYKTPERTVLFDFYIPKHDLVIEYQGEQHYFHVFPWTSINNEKNRDQEKRDICSMNRLKLIEIPYWWDGSLPQLKLFFP